MPAAAPFSHPIDVRYLEVDQQGVVFNMWYLAYLDDAMTAFLSAGGADYLSIQRAGYDFQVVHTELDWQGSLSWGDRASVRVGLGAVGRTSFTLQFEVMADERSVASASTVYVVVCADGSGKAPIPGMIRQALGPLSPLRSEPDAAG